MIYLRVWLLTLVLLGFQHTLAGTLTQGRSCSASNDHLDSVTHRFITECSDKDFCSAPLNGTCVQKVCARDEYPFGYDGGESTPPRCPLGSFCPDQGSGCKSLLALGQPCQLYRDEQCSPPPNWFDLASSMNFNGSICLQQKCVYANVTFGQPCGIENTTTIGIGSSGEQTTVVMTRDNCQSPNLFCDPDIMICEHTKYIGGTCMADGECQTHNCNENGICISLPEVPLKTAPWQYALVALFIAAVMALACTILTSINKQNRLEQIKEIQDYCYEQISLRQSIATLHAAVTERARVARKGTDNSKMW